MTLEDRFWSKVKKTNRCWEWHGARSRQGYGHFRRPRDSMHKSQLAHRVAVELLYRAPVPKELCVLHTCDNPPCVNPSHLVIGSKRDNAIDMRRKGRGFTRLQQNHCPNGHEYTPDNTRIDTKGSRRCIVCSVANDRRYWQKKTRIKL